MCGAPCLLSEPTRGRAIACAWRLSCRTLEPFQSGALLRSDYYIIVINVERSRVAAAACVVGMSGTTRWVAAAEVFVKVSLSTTSPSSEESAKPIKAMAGSALPVVSDRPCPAPAVTARESVFVDELCARGDGLGSSWGRHAVACVVHTSSAIPV